MNTVALLISISLAIVIISIGAYLHYLDYYSEESRYKRGLEAIRKTYKVNKHMKPEGDPLDGTKVPSSVDEAYAICQANDGCGGFNQDYQFLTDVSPSDTWEKIVKDEDPYIWYEKIKQVDLERT